MARPSPTEMEVALDAADAHFVRLEAHLKAARAALIRRDTTVCEDALSEAETSADQLRICLRVPWELSLIKPRE